MANTLDSNGLTIKTLTEVITTLTDGMKAIYGSEINVESNSPDGQLINLLAQAVYDNLELLMDIYNSFNVESASGVPLDRLVALNGLARGAATYTIAPVVVTVNQAVTLTGRDALLTNPTASVFTVQDDAGNQFQLLATHAFAAAGSASLSFQASTPGAVEVSPNTITQQTTVVVGVTDVNNPSVAGVVVGVDEETDAALKMRRAQMFKLPSMGPADAIEAALLAPMAWMGAVIQAEDAMVVENATAAPVGGVPAYSVYAIVKQHTNPGHRYVVAWQIYTTKTLGCGQHGGESEAVARMNGLSFTAKWDWAVAQDLHLQFAITPRTTGVTFDGDVVKAELAAALVYRLGQNASVGDIVVAMGRLFPDAIVTSLGVSLDGLAFSDLVSPTALKNYFTVSTANIDIL